MTAHELAKKLLEMPEDTIVCYLEEGKLIYTKVNNVIACRTGGSHLEPKLQDVIRQHLPSAYAMLNTDEF